MIHIKQGCIPLLTDTKLWIGTNTERKSIGCNINENISHFIGSMKKWASRCPVRFKFIIIYKGETIEIEMGE